MPWIFDGIDIIQVPANILDRRFENIGVFNKAKSLIKTFLCEAFFFKGFY